MREQGKVMRERLAEAEAWIGGDAGALDAGRLGRLDALLEIVEHFEHHVGVARIVLHGLGLALRVHEHDGSAPVSAATARLLAS